MFWRAGCSLCVKGWNFSVRYSTLLHLPPLRFPLCQRMLGSTPGLLQPRHWQPDALNARLDLIHKARSHPQCCIHTLADESVHCLVRNMWHEERADIVVELTGVLPHQDRQNRQVFPVPKHIIDFCLVIFLLTKFTLFVCSCLFIVGPQLIGLPNPGPWIRTWDCTVL